MADLSAEYIWRPLGVQRGQRPDVTVGSAAQQSIRPLPPRLSSNRRLGDAWWGAGNNRAQRPGGFFQWALRA